MVIATRKSFGKALLELGGIENRIVVLDADLSKSTMSKMFAEKYPERFFEMGISEANMIGVAAGLASCGKIPFAYTIADFLVYRAFEQIRNDVCLQRMNVKLC